MVTDQERQNFNLSIGSVSSEGLVVFHMHVLVFTFETGLDEHSEDRTADVDKLLGIPFRFRGNF